MEGSIYTFALFIEYLSERLSRLRGQPRNGDTARLHIPNYGGRMRRARTAGRLSHLTANKCGMMRLQADCIGFERKRILLQRATAHSGTGIAPVEE